MQKAIRSRQKGISCSIIIAACLLVSGCAYMDVQAPMDRSFDNTELGAKEGYAHAASILWLFAWGDGGTRAAADNGNIQVIRHADVRLQSYLFGAYTKVTTIVYGD